MFWNIFLQVFIIIVTIMLIGYVFYRIFYAGKWK